MSWTDDGIKELVRIWNEGASASQCAEILTERLGFYLSRSAIIGKIHRVRLQHPEWFGPARTPQRTARSPRGSRPKRVIPPKPPKAPAVPRREAQAKTVIVAPIELPPLRISLLARDTRRQCAYPLWGDEALTIEAMVVCGNPTLTEGAPYCPFHSQRCHYQAQDIPEGSVES